MEKKQDHRHLLELGKLSLASLKKPIQSKQCHLKDLQPFLEYSPWHFFESSIERFIGGCKKSIHFLAHSIRELHILTVEIGMESQMFQTLSKSTSVAGLILRTKRREFHINTKGGSSGRPLYELLAHKRTYSKVPKN